MAAPFELHSTVTDQALLDASGEGSETVGLSGLLAESGHRAKPVTLDGTATVEAYAWRALDQYSPTWWPQGIEVGMHNGIPLAITSWFAQRKRGRTKGSRISVIDLRNPQKPTYHHVLLVAPRRSSAGVVFDPVEVHAGGIVWSGDRLLVAATFGGIREFRLSDILSTPRKGILRRASGLYGYRFVLPEAGRYLPPKSKSKRGMRYSFLALETVTGDSTGRDPEVENGLRIVAGEYGKNHFGRVARLTLAPGATVIDTTHVPDIPEMQGAVVHNGTWFINASRGDKQGGDLWVGTPGAMKRNAGVLPIGPEDIAIWPERRQMWSVTEFPGKRWVYALDIDRWMPGAP
jgi:hypothetical protein